MGKESGLWGGGFFSQLRAAVRRGLGVSETPRRGLPVRSRSERRPAWRAVIPLLLPLFLFVNWDREGTYFV